ncbi:tetratricopeptide repeat-containing sulfotransferase family protein [Phenylobacterium montanum]|uniref:Sulfotransferase n=1 Tax=Phenylobacterium montanum TaxID=2823693 RepID=A0A975G228_9CAUL|nr:sulfotransferase [Caulobacter sp. S6]QUD88571.1 sulfotransferase [Caulobacter sp. S6]
MTPQVPPRDVQKDQATLARLAETLRAGRHEDAIDQAEAALADGLIHPLPLRLAATRRQRVGRFDEAIHLFRWAVRLTPDDPNGWAALSACLFAARRPEAALEASAEALKRAPDEPALLCGRAQILRSLSRVDQAALLFRRALAIRPGLPEAAMGVAVLAVEAGAWDEAEAARQALRASTGEAAPTLWLSAKVALGRGEAQAARAAIAQLLETRELSPEQRAEALLMQSQALDALDRCPEAFQAAAQGKAIQRQLFAERAAGREAEVAKLKRLASWFAKADAAAWRQAPPAGAPEAAGHVFLVGFPRSGTTLLEQVLAGHPDVVALEEAPTLAAHYAEFMVDDAGLQRLAALDAEAAALWRARYWAEVRAMGAEPAGKIFVDKAPAGTLYLPLVAKLFPQAKALFAIRDPRDVVLSCLRQDFQLNAMTYAFTTLTETAACYDACMGLAEVYRRLLPLPWLDLRHEALVEDFDTVLAEVAAFVGLEVTPAMADFAATAARRQVRTPSATQVRAGLSRRGLGRWRAYERELAPVAAPLAPWVLRFGYE